MIELGFAVPSGQDPITDRFTSGVLEQGWDFVGAGA
jgi:hypothetical protein